MLSLSKLFYEMTIMNPTAGSYLIMDLDLFSFLNFSLSVVDIIKLHRIDCAYVMSISYHVHVLFVSILQTTGLMFL